MDQAALATLIARGLAKAGTITGSTFEQYRPTATTNPTLPPSVGSVSGILDPDVSLSLQTTDFRHGSEASWIGDPSVLLAGDYLVGERTCFVAQIEPLRPAICIVCNRTLAVYQPAAATTAGMSGYGGRTASSDQLLASGWPASVLPKTHVEIDPTQLPSDIKTSFFDVALPASLGITMTFGLRIIDDYGQCYLVSTAALTVAGWRLTVAIETT